MPQAPCIGFLSDFGLRDAYVGMVKGVLHTHASGVTVTDLTHEVAAGDIASAAYLLSSAWKYFPPGSVFLAVVDPGVGTDRAVLAAEIDGYFYVAPDNGLLGDLLNQAESKRVVHATRREFYLSPMSRTFHGRDVFAPLAAALARGIALSDLGPEANGWITLPRRAIEDLPAGGLCGEVIYVDRFGNLITNIPAPRLPLAPVFNIAGHRIQGLARSYAASDPGKLLAIVGSGGHLEISVNGSSAAAHLRVGIGSEITVQGRTMES